MVPFLWIGFTFLKATEALHEGKLHLTTKSPGVPLYLFDQTWKDAWKVEPTSLLSLNLHSSNLFLSFSKGERSKGGAD